MRKHPICDPRPIVRLAAVLLAILGPLGLQTVAAQAPHPVAAAAPDLGTPSGTGPYKAIVVVDPGLPQHTIYRAADIAALGRTRMPIVAWANGGCSGNGTGFQVFLTEIASHGFLVIATGTPGGVGMPPMPVAPAAPAPAASAPPFTGPGPGADPTQSSQLIDAIDWAVARNSDPHSPYFNHLAPTKIAVMGQSCGGLQALDVAPDPRITTSVIWNSGIYNRGSGRSGVKIDKSRLEKLHAPIAYFIGGPRDIAYPNAMDDFSRIDKVPVFMGNLDVGHGGTYREPDGGRFAPVAVAWLRWQLQGDKGSAAMFTGAGCGLCTDPAWTVQKKRID